MSLTNEPFLYKDVRLLLNFTLNSLLNYLMIRSS